MLEIQETPAGPAKRKALLVIVAMVFTLLAWSIVGRLDIVTSAPGMVVAAGHIKVVQPMATSVVDGIYVHDDQQVHKGQLLLTLDHRVAASDLRTSEDRLALLAREAASERRLVDAGALAGNDYDRTERDLATEEARLTSAQQRYRLDWLRSPVDGYVQDVKVTTVGAVVTPAQTLVSIVPKGMPLLVEADVSNRDIGFVEPGQPVRVKLDTFPFEKYGTLPGEVVWVSPDAEGSSGRAGLPEPPTLGDGHASRSADAVPQLPRYRAHVRLLRSYVVVNGQRQNLRPGMSVQADIVTDHRRVIEFLLSPIATYVHEGLGVR